jgi:hypothetical protein
VCWGTGPSGAGDDVFQQLSGAGSSGNELCGLTLAGTIDCFSGGYAKDMQPTEGTFAEVFASLRMACAQDAAGIVSCWGNPSNLDNLDAPDVPLTGVSFGGSSGCGFTVSGGIECWGNPGLEDDRLLPDRMDYSALYIEGSACGLFGDGQIGCWSLSGTSFLPPDAGWVQVAPGISVMCALHMDGHVACVGNGTDGWAEQGKPRPMDLEFEEISVGEDFGCGITTELDVVCWGGDGGEETNSPAGLKAIALDDLAP